MIRGTTPTHTFTVSQIDTSQIKQLRITYSQMGRLVLEKTEKDVTMGDGRFEFTMTQEEALSFRASIKVDVQVKVMMMDGSVLASVIETFGVDKILNTEVLG